jgi:hypothetical protein
MSRRRTTKPSLTFRIVGHSFGVIGAIMGIDAIVTSINPRFLRLFPYEFSGIQQTSAALISIGLVALALWLVSERDQRAPAKIEPNDPN